ncbi:MAG TPA: nitrate/sulfonate/bicarbonate ABC transporter ATP-binding protein, partial [Ktedonobacterales bacterium]
DAGGTILVLDDITLELRAGEFVALLGPSGSGKSTLLRILAGLIPPSSGQVLAHERPLQGTNPAVAIVFQSFALYPWLTVLENAEFGLLASDTPPSARHARAVRAIDLVGLDGFESAYPRELSGGMKQRVGLARALVVEPEALFLDEPFSALDVLVAENLRHEISDLWRERKLPTRAILMVTHNIDDAVSMADRLIVFGANPGRIRAELSGLPLAQRSEKGGARAQLVDTIYRIMTNPHAEVATLLTGSPGAQSAEPVETLPTQQSQQAIPHVGIGELTGFIERLHALQNREDLYELARDLQLDADDLLPLAEAANLLGFADIEAGDVVLTASGLRFAAADILSKKEVFREQATGGIRLIRAIVGRLQASPEQRVAEDDILAELERAFSAREARRQLDTAIDWGRYAEVFAYDDDSGSFFLDEDAATGAPTR